MDVAENTACPTFAAGCLGLLCSSRCPGGLVLKLYDLAKALRDAAVPVVGGFQTPMEQEALTVLLRGRQPVIWVPSWHRPVRGLPLDAQRAHQDGRLVLQNIFPESCRRPSRQRGRERNQWIVDHCRALVIVHATPGGDTGAVLQAAIGRGVPTAFLDDPANEGVFEGNSVIRVGVADVPDWFRSIATSLG